jgi:hypothetical protein
MGRIFNTTNTPAPKPEVKQSAGSLLKSAFVKYNPFNPNFGSNVIQKIATKENAIKVGNTIKTAITPTKGEVRMPFSSDSIKTTDAPLTRGAIDMTYRTVESFVKAPVVLGTELVNVLRKDKIQSIKVPLLNAKILGYETKEIPTASGEVTQAIANGEDPFTASLRVVSTKSLDSLIGASIISGVAKVVTTQLAKGGLTSILTAWKTLGNPQTLKEADSAFRKIALQLKPGTMYGNDEAFKVLNEAMQVIRKNGIPNLKMRLQEKVLGISELLARETSVTPFSTLSTRFRNPDLAPRPIYGNRVISGELPGLAIDKGEVPYALGLSTKKMKSVGGTPSEVPKKLPYRDSYNPLDKNDARYLERIFGKDQVDRFKQGDFSHHRGGGREYFEKLANANLIVETPKTTAQKLEGRVKPYTLEQKSIFHGTSPENIKTISETGFKVGSALPEDAFRGGGYDAKQNSISFSTDPQIAANFSGTGSRGGLIEVDIKPNARIVTVDGIDYAEDLNDFVKDLRKQGVDAVYLAGEKEVAVINKDIIGKVLRSQEFEVFKRREQLTDWKAPESQFKITPDEIKKDRSVLEVEATLQKIFGTDIPVQTFSQLPRDAEGEMRNGVINLLEKSGNVSDMVAKHEGWHMYKRVLITKEEQATVQMMEAELLTKFPEKAKALKEAGYNPEEIAEELMADEFARYYKTGKTAFEKLKAIFDKIIQKLEFLFAKKSSILKYFKDVSKNVSETRNTSFGVQQKRVKASLTPKSLKTEEAFQKSTRQIIISRLNSVEFSLGEFGENALIRKATKEDRLPKELIIESVNNIKTARYGSDDPTGFRYDNLVWISEMPNGETRAIVTRKNKAGQEEIINFFKVGKNVDEFINNLGSIPSQSRTGILTLEKSQSNPLTYGDSPSVATGDNFVNQITQQIDPIDQAIADGKIRVVSRDGRDTYQYKVKDGWKTARDETSALKRVQDSTKAQTPKEEVITPTLEEKRLALEFKQETLDNSPFNHPDNRYLVDREGRIKELGDMKNREIINRIETRIAESGYTDPTKFAKDFETYLNTKKALKEERKIFNSELKEFKDTTKATLEVEKETLKQQLLQQREVQRTFLENTSKEEVESIERQAQAALAEKDAVQMIEAYSLPKIIQDTQTPVKNKIGWQDWIRTPDRVLKKIGLAKEAKLIRQQYDKYIAELPVNLQIITDWFESFPKNEREKSGNTIFRFLDGQKMEGPLSSQEFKVAVEIRTYLNEWAERLGIPSEGRIINYITRLFDDQLIQKEFDEDLAKIIADKIPGSVYNPFLEKRLGAMGYKQDVWAALDAYTKRATRKVHMDVALEAFDDISGTLEKRQWDYVKTYLDRVNMRPTDWDSDLDVTIKQIFGYKFGARPVANISRQLRKFAYRGMLGLNISSAIKNLSQGANTYAVLGEKYTALGYAELFKPYAHKELAEMGVLNAGYIEDRTISATKKVMEKVDKVLFSLMDTAERINRGAAYFGAKKKALNAGYDEHRAREYGKKVVRDTQFTFSSLDTGVILQSDIAKLLTQLQSFTIKQGEFLIDQAMAKNYIGLIRYGAAGLLFVYGIGKSFGMEPKDLIPMYRVGAPPALQFVYESGRAVFDAPDAFGNKRDMKQKASDISKAFLKFIPASSQIKKTYEAIMSNREGASLTKDGKIKFLAPTTPLGRVRTLLFGQYATEEARLYFNRVEDAKQARNGAQPFYDSIQDLIAKDKTKEAQELLDSLTDEQYEVYKELLKEDKAKKMAEGKKNMRSTYAEVQVMIREGKVKEAQAVVDALSDDEFTYYDALAKEFKRAQDVDKKRKPTWEDGEVSTDAGIISIIGTYSKALALDPIQTFDLVFTNQRIRRVDNGTVIIERDATLFNSASDIPYEERYSAQRRDELNATTDQRLDHIIPIQLGGEDEDSNTILVPVDLWELYTPVENHLGTLLRNKKISKQKAQQLILDFKQGKITAESIMKLE